MPVPSFLKQTVMRTSIIFLVKAIGLAVRIPLFRLLGSEGTGIYQIVYSIFGFALTLTVGGFPTSLALLTATNAARGLHFFNRLVVPFLMLGVCAASIYYAIAPYLAMYLGDSRLSFPIRCIAPALVIIPLLQLYRGLLQGIESYMQASVSELIEQAVRAGTMLLLAVLWMKSGIHAAVGGAAFGAFTGGLIALCFLGIWKNKTTSSIHSGRRSARRWSVPGPEAFLFMKSSLAIMLTRLISPASDLLDALIIPHRLQISGLSHSGAVAVFGEIFGMASIIVYLPTIVTAAMSYTVASKLSASWQSHHRKDFIERSNFCLEIGWLWGLSSAMILFFHADELSALIFGNEDAAKAIRLMSFVPVIAGMRELTTTVLWTIDLKRAPFRGSLLGLACSATAVYGLTAIPGFGYAGAAIGILLFELVPLLWNALVMHKHCKGALSVGHLLGTSLFLVLMPILHAPMDAFLSHIGLESSIIRSLVSILFFTMNMALYILYRFGKK